MKLHEDVNAFRVLINDIHERTGYRLDVLEKDYYVVLMLEELAKLQDEGLPAYFKGGTALYKALHTTNRFSEDIDLSVDTRNCSRTQNDKRLEKATKKYTSLERESGEGFTNRSEVVSVYSYKPVMDYDKDDVLQRFGKLKIEATSFTISEPVTYMVVAAMVYELATREQREILEDMLSCRMLNFDEKEKETILTLLQKYYNHVSCDFDIQKTYQIIEPEMPSLFGASAPEGEMTREFLEENWVVSSYDEGEDCQLDYYMHEMNCFPGEKAYCYSHEDDELRELEIVHAIARMDNAERYDELIQDEDVLINGEEEYGADCSAEFTGMFSCYLMWFKEV